MGRSRRFLHEDNQDATPYNVWNVLNGRYCNIYYRETLFQRKLLNAMVSVEQI